MMSSREKEGWEQERDARKKNRRIPPEENTAAEIPDLPDCKAET
jgi:hypothetical protein